MPSIYVASLTDYNAGRLHGVRIEVDAFTTVEDIEEQVQRMLADSPEAKHDPYTVAEEWAIHDHEEWHGLPVDEWTSFETLVGWAAALEQHGEAFGIYVGHVGGDPSVEDFEDAYRGEFESIDQYAYDLATDTAPDRETRKLMTDGQWPFSCIDWNHAGDELVTSGDIWTAESHCGDLHVFSNY